LRLQTFPTKGYQLENSTIWFGDERAIITPGSEYTNMHISSRAIHCIGEPGSGWKFEVVTKCDNPNIIGEIITLVMPKSKKPYTSSLYLPTLFTSGLQAASRIEATRVEYIYYLDFILNTRHKVLNNWKELRLSEDNINEIQDSIARLRAAIEHRETQPIKEVFETIPRFTDSTGKLNPGAANAKFTAMASRLDAQITNEGASAGSMQKRRRFAAKILASIEQDIWDMRNLHRLSPISVARELEKRIDNSLIKPMLYARLYCKNKFNNSLGDTEILPRVIEVYTTEVQLMAIRNLIADIQRSQNIKENMRILQVLLSVRPNELEYSIFFDEIQNTYSNIESLINRDNSEYKNLCDQLKKSIRFRASNDPSHPWYINTASPALG
jgi:hypothetical protein